MWSACSKPVRRKKTQMQLEGDTQRTSASYGSQSSALRKLSNLLLGSHYLESSCYDIGQVPFLYEFHNLSVHKEIQVQHHAKCGLHAHDYLFSFASTALLLLFLPAFFGLLLSTSCGFLARSRIQCSEGKTLLVGYFGDMNLHWVAVWFRKAPNPRFGTN